MNLHLFCRLSTHIHPSSTRQTASITHTSTPLPRQIDPLNSGFHLQTGPKLPGKVAIISTLTYYALPQLLNLLIQFAICTVSAQQNGKHNIPLGSSLSAHSRNSKWTSPSGEFAFGLYSILPNRFVLGIWFDGIPDKTLLWTANTDGSVAEGSTVELTTTGDLILYDSHRTRLWTAYRTASGEVSAAAMLDDGNFVLLDATSQQLWQSFDSPTDTLLPGQPLRGPSIMYSKASPSNYSTGRFELSLQEDGNLLLYPVERRAEPQGAYWASGTSKTGNQPMTLNFEKSGGLYLVNGTGSRVSNLTDGDAGPGKYFRRVTLDTDGILRQYVWITNVTTPYWSPIWRVVKDPCRDVKSQCGINGICTLTDKMEPDCVCPPGYGFIDQDDHFKGCLRNSSQNCSARSIMWRLENTDWLNGADYSILYPMDEGECQKACLDDCSCIVVTHGNEICYKKRSPLIDGRQGTDITNKAFVKVSDDSPSDSNYNSRQPIRRKQHRALLFIGIGLVAFSTLLLAPTVVIWYCGIGLNRRISSSASMECNAPEGLKAFSYKEIETATEGFKHQLGMGAFGTVYKGLLSDGRAIAVKKLDRLSQEGETEFRTEMRIIGTTHHKNLVQLFGFCDEGSHRILVYEYMINGSLDAALFHANDFLSWDLRVKIAVETARGVLYLHEECRTRIIHCDIKPQNILLDDAFNPKISDFGLAKLMGKDQTRTFTAARGTRGYAAPEWHKNMAITTKADVYSFGMMLLEMISCRKGVDLDAAENEIVLSEWIYECLKSGRLVKLVEHQQLEDGEIEIKHVERMVLAGLWCIQEDPSLRPSMKKVVQMLEGTVDIAVPPPPKSFISSL